MSEKLEVGSIVEGKVIRVKPFGAIVSIGEQAQGLVHISQVANSFVQDINDHVKVGDTVTVKVLSVEPVNNKIALAMKEALPREPRRTSGDRAFDAPFGRISRIAQKTGFFVERMALFTKYWLFCKFPLLFVISLRKLVGRKVRGWGFNTPAAKREERESKHERTSNQKAERQPPRHPDGRSAGRRHHRRADFHGHP